MESQLKYSSSEPQVATVDAKGLITAVGAGTCKITAASTDGTEKQVEATVKVLPFAAEETEITVTSKQGQSIAIQYYGSSLDDLAIAVTNKASATVEYTLLQGAEGAPGDLIF